MFDDIRPYRDHEVVDIIQRLINERELQVAIASLVAPKWYRYLPALSCFVVKQYLARRVKKITSVDDLQLEVAKYLRQLLKTTTKGFSYHGLANLDLTKPALFISNHRDIVLDAALVNLALFENGGSTVEAAVGDNLLHRPWVADLMRLNKSFVVKRGEKSKRAMLQASKQLSAYIHHTITESQQNIWIAQREGRAKDGVDRTNAALISMLLLNKDKETSIEDYLKQLNIVPVAISYEYDPCDQDKAKELAAKAATGVYQKAEGEDLRSITQGIVGQKGKIHLEFGQPVRGNFDSSKAIAHAIDQQIIQLYKLFDSNISAYQHLTNEGQVNANATIDKRLTALSSEQQHWLLTMYANPVFAKKALEQKLAS